MGLSARQLPNTHEAQGPFSGTSGKITNQQHKYTYTCAHMHTHIETHTNETKILIIMEQDQEKRKVNKLPS